MIRFRSQLTGYDDNQVNEMAGLLPYMADENDPRPAVEQLDAAYAHGGGWRAMPKFELDTEKLLLKYPGDPVMKPIGVAKLRDERIVLYDYAIVAVIHADNTYEVSRMD